MVERLKIRWLLAVLAALFVLVGTLEARWDLDPNQPPARTYVDWRTGELVTDRP